MLLALVLSASLASAGWRAPLRVQRVDSGTGLSHNSVYAVLRDRRGFIWAGTPDGLNRFDGYEVRRFHHDPDDPASLSHQVVRALLEDRQGNLLIGTDNSLNVLDRATNRFRRIALDGERRVFRLYEDRRGVLWVGADGAVFRRGPSDRAVTRAATVEGEVHDFAESPAGVVWALVQHGAASALHALDGSGRTLAVSESWGWVTNFAIDPSGRFWLKPPLAARVDASTNALQPQAPPDPTLIVNRVRANGAEIWMATDHGLCHGSISSRVECRPIDPAAGWLYNYIRDLWIDDEGAVWLGTYTGLLRFDPAAKPFQTWRHDERDPHSLSGDAVSSVVESSDGSLWVGTFGAGLNRLNRRSGEAERFRALPGDPSTLPHDTIWALLLDPEDVLWIASESGLASLDPRSRRFRRHALPFPPDERLGRRTSALARDRSGRLWVGAVGGLYSYDPRTRASRRYPLPGGRGSSGDLDTLDAILVARDGSIWTGNGRSGLLRLDPNREALEEVPTSSRGQTPLTSEGLWDIHEDANGVFWLASGIGLSRFQRSTGQVTRYLPRDGLPSSFIYSVTEDRQGRLWLGTSRGLVRFDPAEPGATRMRTFETADGIASLEFNRHAATRTRSGEQCFGGIGGLTCFDPERIRDDPRPPRVVLSEIEVHEGRRTITVEPFGRDAIELRHDDDPFVFTFAALSFANPQKNLYQYRLENFDRGWIDAGTRRLARYTNVPPGHYVFRVRASNSDLTWNREGASIRVRILPPFWMTWWFRGLAAAAFAAFLYAAYRYRMRRLIELERVRLRIAADLHDDVTSELSGISMLAELTRRRIPDDAPAAQQLEVLRDRASELASAMRDLAWGIHPEHDTAGSMLRRMRSTGSILLGDTPLFLETAGLEEGFVLPMLVRRSLFLVFKESLHNARRHARASEVRVLLQRSDHALLMTIEDDGDGFDPAAAHTGDGLRNMKRRVEELGGGIDVRSGHGRGCTVAVRVPLRPGGHHEDSGWLRRPEG